MKLRHLTMLMVWILALWLLSSHAFAVERSCSSRVFISLHGYQIDLMNHLTTTASGNSAESTRFLAARTLDLCIHQLWKNRDALRGMQLSHALQLVCPNASVKGMSALAIDMESRIKKFACSKTWRTAVDQYLFHAKLRVEHRGERGCGGIGERKNISTIDEYVYVLPDMCSLGPTKFRL